MSLKHVLLGCLYEKPMTGFDLKKTLDGAISHFWRAELSQIYPTLKRMQEESLVTCEAGNRDKVYHITKAGRDELLGWLRAPTEPAQQRDAFMVKVYFGSYLEDEEVSRIVEDQKRRHQRRLAEYEEALAEGNRILRSLEGPAARDFRIKLLTLRAGIEFQKYWVTWCDETVSEIAALSAASGGSKEVEP